MAILKIGDVEIERVEEMRIPNSISYFTVDAALIEANRGWLAPHFLDGDDKFDLVFQSFVFVADERVVLVDPCTGNGRRHTWPWFDNLDVPYIERLTEPGFRAEDVDLVVCTHLHHDHCGWNTQLRDGKWVPTFPNARYIIRQEEYDRWGPRRQLYPGKDYNEGIFERSVQPVIDAGLADLVSGEHSLSPGMTVLHAPGHTVGHQILHLASDGDHGFFTGDCFHHPIQLVEPALPFGDPEDLAAIATTRQRLVDLSAELGAWLIAAHLAAPHASRAVRGSDGLRFKVWGEDRG